MERMGHSTSRAALIYLHSTSARQHHLADAVTARARSELGETDKRRVAGAHCCGPGPLRTVRATPRGTRLLAAVPFEREIGLWRHCR